MRKRMAMGVVYALIATGIGTWAACNGDMTPSTVPEPAATVDEFEASASVAVPERLKTNLHPSDGPAGPEVRHEGGHRVWIERETPASEEQLCEGDPIPALVVRRSDPLGDLHGSFYISDPELESTTPLGKRRHEPPPAPAENAFELEDGETVLAVATPGSIGVCPDCSDVREVVVGINGDLHDHDDGSDHAGTYEVGPALRFAVRKETDAVCRGRTE